MEEIDRLASVSVWRGVGFSALAIGTAMSGTVFDLGLTFQLGAALTLLLSTVLYLKAETFHRRKVTDTEVWIMLAPEHRPPRPVAGRLIATAMRAELLQKARYALVVGSGMLATAALIWLGRLLA